MVRQLAHCPPRSLRHLIFRKMGSDLHMSELKTCMLFCPDLRLVRGGWTALGGAGCSR